VSALPTLALAASVAAILALLGVVHVFWALGSMRLSEAAVPQIEGRVAFKPGRAATVAVAVALFLAALCILARGGVIALPLPWGVFYWATWALAFVFIGRAIGDFRLVGFFKRVRGSPFARLDTLAYSPLCLILGLAMLWLALR